MGIYFQIKTESDFKSQFSANLPPINWDKCSFKVQFLFEHTQNDSSKMTLPFTLMLAIIRWSHITNDVCLCWSTGLVTHYKLTQNLRWFLVTYIDLDIILPLLWLIHSSKIFRNTIFMWVHATDQKMNEKIRWFWIFFYNRQSGPTTSTSLSTGGALSQKKGSFQ